MRYEINTACGKIRLHKTHFILKLSFTCLETLSRFSRMWSFKTPWTANSPILVPATSTVLCSLHDLRTSYTEHRDIL